MADVLSLLRAAVSAGQRVERAEDDLLFAGGKKFPYSTLTSYMRARGTGDAYTLGTVWFYCQEHAKSSLGAYRAAVREAGEHVTTVEQVDQNDMLTYFSGQSDSSVAVMVHVDLDVRPSGSRLAAECRRIVTIVLWQPTIFRPKVPHKPWYSCNSRITVQRVYRQ